MRRMWTSDSIPLAVHGVVKALFEIGLGQPGIEIQGLGALPEACHVAVKEGNHAQVQPQAFPDAIAEDKAAVEYGDDGLVPRVQLAVDVDSYALIAFIRLNGMRAGGHGVSSVLTESMNRSIAPSSMSSGTPPFMRMASWKSLISKSSSSSSMARALSSRNLSSPILYASA